MDSKVRFRSELPDFVPRPGNWADLTSLEGWGVDPRFDESGL